MNENELKIKNLEAAYISAVEAGKNLAKQCFKVEKERDNLIIQLYSLQEQFNSPKKV